MQLSIPHKLSRPQAVQKLKDLLAEAKPKIAGKATIDEERWDGDTLHFAFTAQGQHVTGQVEVQDAAFNVNVKLPFMLKLFEGQIKQAIDEQLKQLDL